MRTRNGRKLWAATLMSALAATTGAAHADECGQPPAAVQYSRNFYKAEAKYYASNSQTQAGLTIPIEGIPIGGSFGSSDATEGWETLTLSEAEMRRGPTTTNARSTRSNSRRSGWTGLR